MRCSTAARQFHHEYPPWCAGFGATADVAVTARADISESGRVGRPAPATAAPQPSPTNPAAKPAPATNTAETLAIATHFGGDAQLFTTYRAACLEQFAADVQAGDAAAQAHDWPALRRLAHSLATVLLTLGRPQDSLVARALEDAAAVADTAAQGAIRVTFSTHGPVLDAERDRSTVFWREHGSDQPASATR